MKRKEMYISRQSINTKKIVLQIQKGYERIKRHINKRGKKNS